MISLVSCRLVSSQSHALWRVLSNKVIWVLGHCWFNTPHMHSSEWDFLFFQSCLLSTVTVTPSDSDYVNRSTSVQRFRLIHMTPSRRSRETFLALVPQGACAPGSRRTKSLDTVATRVVTVISHCIVLFCERYLLAGVWCLCYVWWHTFFIINCLGIELVLCNFKLYPTRFVLTKGLLFNTLFIVFFTNCVVVITEYVNSNHCQYRWIGEPNNTLESNGPWTRFFYEKKCAAGKIFCKRMRRRPNFCKKMSSRQDFFWLNPDGYSASWCSV